MTSFTVQIYTAAEWAELEIEATTAKRAMSCARRQAENGEVFHFESYAEAHDVQDIRVHESASGDEVARWIDPEVLVRRTGPKLLAALKALLDDDDNSAPAHSESVIAQARAAVAEAEGRS